MSFPRYLNLGGRQKSESADYDFGAGALTIGGGACTTVAGFFLGFLTSRRRASLLPILEVCHRSLSKANSFEAVSLHSVMVDPQYFLHLSGDCTIES
jgi:hypothetical protein